MKGVASILDPSTSARVEALWKELETGCGLVGIKITPIPHFTWQVTEDYPTAALEQALRDLARQTAPFIVQTVGLGVFTGEHPILYIPVLKSEALIRLHAHIWERLAGIAIQPSDYYTPANWAPHITLAHGDVDLNKLACAVQALASRDFAWEIHVDNFVSIELQSDRKAEFCRYTFGGG